MSKRLRILHLEDDPDYSALVRDMLARDGIEAEVITVADRETFEQALGGETIDLILADYLLPSFNGIQALQRAREVCPRIPFLLVSGTIGEQAAIESLRAGATDYVLKQWPERLVPAVRRAAEEADERARRRRAETELVRREKYFRTLTENALDVLTILNREGTFIYNSPSMKRVLGYEPQQLAGQNAFALVHEEDLPKVMEAFQFGLAHPETAVTHSFRARHSDGSWRHLEAVGQNRLNDPEISGIVLNLRDISDRKRAEDSLRESEKEYRLIFQGNPNPMWVFDLETLAFLEVNEAAIQHYGYSREEFLAMTLRDIRIAEELPQLLDYHTKVRRREILFELGHGCIWHHRKKDGTIVDVEVKWSPIGFRGCFAALTLANDVTERRRIEDQLRQSQKMEAIGQLAGGVAHDFNNILTVIHGHASLLMAGGALDGMAAKSAQQIGQAAERAAGLTRQLLTFSRRQVMQPRRLDLNEVVGNMTKMLGRILGEDITLQVNYWPQPPLVEADASMMEQVLLNLAVNSRDAMPKGGQIAIRISVRDVDEQHVHHHPEARAGRFVCVTLADTGCGIPPENLRRIFEPFFTTKEVGKGTGLGLATVYGVVKQHNGWVEVESEVDKGTVFRVYIPRCTKPDDEGDEKPAPIAVRGGTETILVVEDENPVRELVCSVLQGHGYRILQAESGVKALEIWRQHKEEIDLLLTDLVMPDRVNGKELAEKLLAECPDLKVIFTSGYSAEVVGKEFVLQWGLNYLQKPYHPQKLALTVRECLDGGNGGPEI